MVEVKTFTTDIKNLTPTEYNPRQISEADFKQLKKSLKDFPEMKEIREIVVDENMRILGGHQRIKALQSLGETQVFVKQVIGLTEHQKDEFMIKDNVQQGDWDTDMLANMFDVEQLEDWGLDLSELDFVEKEKEIIEDETPEPQKEAKSKLGEIYQLGEHRLMCGDSTDQEQVNKLMDGKEADLWLTDPPYNVAVQNSQGMTIKNDDMNADQFQEFLDKATECAKNCLKQGGGILCIPR